MGHLFQAERWAKHPIGFICFIMAKEIGKGKGFGKEKWNFWYIYI